VPASPERFDLDNVSANSQEGDDFPDPVLATPSRRQRRAARHAEAEAAKRKAANDAQSFFSTVNGKKLCKFCL